MWQLLKWIWQRRFSVNSVDFLNVNEFERIWTNLNEFERTWKGETGNVTQFQIPGHFRRCRISRELYRRRVQTLIKLIQSNWIKVNQRRGGAGRGRAWDFSRTAPSCHWSHELSFDLLHCLLVVAVNSIPVDWIPFKLSEINSNWRQLSNRFGNHSICFNSVAKSTPIPQYRNSFDRNSVAKLTSIEERLKWNEMNQRCQICINCWRFPFELVPMEMLRIPRALHV